MSRLKMIFSLFFVVLEVKQAPGERIMTWQSITHRHNPAIIKYFVSSITQPHNLSFNMEGAFLTEMPCGSMLALEIKARQPGKATFMSVLKFKYSLHDILKGVRNNFFKILRESLAKYTNTPKQCPLLPNFIWRVNNFSVPIEQFPLILSEFNLLVDFKATTPNNDSIILFTLKGRIDCKVRKGFDCGTDLKRG